MVDDKMLATLSAHLDQIRASLRDDIYELGRRVGGDCIAELLKETLAGDLPPDRPVFATLRQLIGEMAFVTGVEILTSLAQEKLDKGKK